MVSPLSSAGDDDLVRELVLRAASSTLDALSVLTAETDGVGEIVDFRMRFTNAAAAEVTGVQPEDAIGRTIGELFPQRAAWLVALWASAVRSGEPVIEEIELRRTDGPNQWIRQQIVPVGDAIAITSHEITSRKLAEQELRHRANHDALTGLPNRTLAQERIARAVGLGETLVVFADLDRFKAVNDQLGHAAGDDLLVQAARRLRACLRSEDLVARFGGDEFLICISDPATVEDVDSVAAKILDAMRYPFHLDGRSVTTTVSIGAARGRPGDDPADLIRRADAAAYRSKRSGRNSWTLFDEDVRREVESTSRDDRALAGALGSGSVQHRPMAAVRLDDGRIHSVLLTPSWPHPDHGVRAAADYAAATPTSERIAELDRVTAWLDRSALATLAASLPLGAFARIPLYGSPPEVDLLTSLRTLFDGAELPPDRFAVDVGPAALDDEQAGPGGTEPARRPRRRGRAPDVRRRAVLAPRPRGGRCPSDRVRSHPLRVRPIGASPGRARRRHHGVGGAAGPRDHRDRDRPGVLHDLTAGARSHRSQRTCGRPGGWRGRHRGGRVGA
jgi:diguanylate cyclase (GGDEF)-like protein/PAS domain S-box-containing protein